MLLFAAEEAFNQEFMKVLVKECLHLILILSAPMLIAALAVGIIIAIFQAVTQVQEQTLSFVPKIVATFLSVVMYGPWIASEVVNFTAKVLGQISDMGPR